MRGSGLPDDLGAGTGRSRPGGYVMAATEAARDTGALGRRDEELRHVGVVAQPRTGLSRPCLGNPPFPPVQPMAPAISKRINRFISAANSIGSSRVNGSMKPNTMRRVAASSSSPRDMR